MAERRQAPRAPVPSPILTQIEAGEKFSALGRARNIGEGGLLIETPETLSPGASVVIRFYLPPKRDPIEAAGRVVRAEAGKSMAIAFLGLPDNHRRKILDFIEAIQGPAEGPLPQPGEGVPRLRRSGRVRRRMAVLLNWQDEEGHQRHETAETQLLSRYGAMVFSFTELLPGQLVRITVPELNKEATARVAWTAMAQLPGRIEIGLEFIGVESFWGMEFPPPYPEPAEMAKAAWRRSARLPRRMDVLVSWMDELGRVREEYAETRMLSQHGALVNCVVALPVGHHLRLRVPDLDREADGHVVWAEPGELPGRTDLGIEFLNVENFWGIDFPPDPSTQLE